MRTSKKCVQRTSRTRSRVCSIPPRLTSALRRASSCGMPLPMLASVSFSRWKRSSSESSASRLVFLKNLNSLFKLDMAPPPSSTLLQDQCNSGRQTFPLTQFFLELFGACGSQFVELGTAIVVGDAPLGIDPASLLQSRQCGIQRSLAHLKSFLGNLLDALGNSPTMHRFERQRFEDQQVQSALQQLHLFAHQASYRMSTRRLDAAFCRMSTRAMGRLRFLITARRSNLW